MPSDLLPQYISLSDRTLAPGEEFSVDWLLVNQGANAADSASISAVRINQSPSSASGTNLDFVYTSALSGGSSDSQSSTLTAPTTPGTYYVWVLADNYSDVDNQSNVSNDLQRSGSFTVTAPVTYSDLIPEDISLSDRTLAPGETFSVDWLLANQGDAAADSSSTTAVRINQSSSSASGNNLDFVSTAALSGGRSDSQSSTLTAPTTPGTYYVWVLADNYSDVDNQSNVSNDLQRSGSFTVTAPTSYADLVPVSLSLGSSSVTGGASLGVDWTILNNGAGNAPATTTGIRITNSAADHGTASDTEEYVPTDALSSGQSDSQSTTIIAPDAPGTYYVWVVADNSDPETGNQGSNTSNDYQLAGSFTVTAPTSYADLVPVSLSLGSSSVTGGASLGVDWTILNNGAGNAPATTTGIRITNSSSDAGDASDTEEYVPTDALSSGQSDSQSTTIIAPDAPGTYYVWVVADNSDPETGNQGSNTSNDYQLAGSFTVTDDGVVPPTDDTVPNDPSTGETLLVGQTVYGAIDTSDMDGTFYDADFFEVTLTGGRQYTFSADATVSGGDTLDQVFIRLRDSGGNKLTTDIADEGATPEFVFNTPGTGTQTYYFAVSAGGSDWLDAEGDYTISLANNGAAVATNYVPWAEANHRSAAPGTEIPLSALFDYGDLNGDDDIVRFAVQDRTATGGHLTYQGQDQDPNETYERPISEIDDWAFVVGSSGTDYVGFKVIDSQGAFNSSVAAAVSAEQANAPLRSADGLFGQQKLGVLVEFAAASYVDKHEKVDELRDSGWQVLSQQDYFDIGLTSTHAAGDYFIYGNMFTNILGGVANAIVAKSPDEKSLVIAFAGTDEIADWENDLVNINNQFRLYAPLFEALEIEDWLRSGKEVIVTGHSLGAAMAQAFVQAYTKYGDVEGVGFANPGLTPGVDLINGIPSVNDHLDNFTSVIISQDPIREGGAVRGYEKEGDLYLLAPLLLPQNQVNIWAPHFMDTYLEAVGQVASLDVWATQKNGKPDTITKNVALDPEILAGGEAATFTDGTPQGALVTPEGVTFDTTGPVEYIDGEWYFGTDAGDTSTLDIDSNPFTNTTWTVSEEFGQVVLTDDAEGELFKADGFGSLSFKSLWARLKLTVKELVGTDVEEETIYFDGGIADDEIDGTEADRRIVATGGDGNDRFEGGSPDDEFRGNSGEDWFHGHGGDDLLKGGDDDDRIFGGRGNDRLYGNKGDDELWADEDDDVLRGGSGRDILAGEEGDDKLFGGGDDDWLVGGTGRDLLDGGDGQDFVVFVDSTPITIDLRITDYQDTGLGMAKLVSIEHLDGGQGNDVLKGDSATNHLRGDGGDDKLVGRGGKDFLYGDLGNDKLIGGDGNDVAVYNSGVDISVDLRTTSFQDTGEGWDRLVSIEYVNTDDGNDTLIGNGANNRFKSDAGEDVLIGRGGNDRIYAGADDDILRGGGGKDRLVGGTGNDKLIGGKDADTFVFGQDFGHDTVKDFDEALANEMLDFSKVATSQGDFTIGLAADGFGTRITLTATGEYVDLLSVAEDSFDLWAHVAF